MGAVFPRYDVDRYNRLRETSLLNMEFFRGTYADLGPGRYTQALFNSPALSRHGSTRCLTATTGLSALTTAPPSPVVSVLQPFTVEFGMLLGPDTTGALYCYPVRQLGANGGWYCVWQTNRISVLARNAAGAIAVQILSPVGSVMPGIWYHIIFMVDFITPTALLWINGIPATPVINVPAPPAVDQNAQLIIGSYSAAGMLNKLSHVRLWQKTPTNDDAACLYAASKNLVSG